MAIDRDKQRRRYGPTPAFWVKLALAANFLAQLLPDWLALLVGLGVLVLARVAVPLMSWATSLSCALAELLRYRSMEGAIPLWAKAPA